MVQQFHLHFFFSQGNKTIICLKNMSCHVKNDSKCPLKSLLTWHHNDQVLKYYDWHTWLNSMHLKVDWTLQFHWWISPVKYALMVHWRNTPVKYPDFNRPHWWLQTRTSTYPDKWEGHIYKATEITSNTHFNLSKWEGHIHKVLVKKFQRICSVRILTSMTILVTSAMHITYPDKWEGHIHKATGVTSNMHFNSSKWEEHKRYQ